MSSKTTRLANLLEAVPDALVGMDQTGVIRFVNRQTESLFGYDRDDLVGQPIQVLVPESLSGTYTGHRENDLTDRPFRSIGLDLELDGRQQDGTEFPVHIGVSPIDTGDVLLVITAVSDVAKRKQALESSELLAAIVENSNDAIIGRSLDGLVTSWNPSAERMYGYPSDEIIGKPFGLLIPEDRAGEVVNIGEKLMAGEPVEHFETSRVRKDGVVFPVSATISPIRSPDGTITGASMICRDMTEQQAAFEASQRMSAIVEYSEDAILSSTLDGIIRSWNPAAERLLGYASEEIIGRPGSLLSDTDPTRELPDVRARIGAGLPVERLETKLTRKDGTTFPASVSVSPIRDADGVVVGASTIVSDVTDANRAFESARSMIESSLDALVAISPEGMITDVNEATVKVTGIPRMKLIGTAFSECFTEPEKAKAIYNLVFEQGMAVDYPLTMRHRNGTLTEVLYNASVYRDGVGKVLGVFAAARDVTKQRKAQREIAEQQNSSLHRLAELERFQRLTVGRELKMIELKKEIESLRRLLEKS